MAFGRRQGTPWLGGGPSTGGYDFGTPDSATGIWGDIQGSIDKAFALAQQNLRKAAEAKIREENEINRELARQAEVQREDQEKLKRQELNRAAQEVAAKEELKQKALQEEDRKVIKEETMTGKAQDAAYRYLDAVDKAQERQDRLRQARMLYDQNQITREQWDAIQRNLDEDRVDSTIARESAQHGEDELYSKAKSDLFREFQAKEGRRAEEGEIEHGDILARAEALKRESPYWRVNPDGSYAFDDSIRRQELKNQYQNAPRPATRGITDEDIERAGEVRYTLPKQMREWGPRMWEFTLGRELGGVMAQESERQKQRFEQMAAQSTSPTGRPSNDPRPLAADNRTAGIGDSQGTPSRSAQKTVYSGPGVGARPATPPAVTSAGPAPRPAAPPAPTPGAPWTAQGAVAAVGQGLDFRPNAPGTNVTMAGTPAERAQMAQAAATPKAPAPTTITPERSATVQPAPVQAAPGLMPGTIPVPSQVTPGTSQQTAADNLEVSLAMLKQKGGLSDREIELRRQQGQAEIYDQDGAALLAATRDVYNRSVAAGVPQELSAQRAKNYFDNIVKTQGLAAKAQENAEWADLLNVSGRDALAWSARIGLPLVAAGVASVMTGGMAIPAMVAAGVGGGAGSVIGNVLQGKEVTAKQTALDAAFSALPGGVGERLTAGAAARMAGPGFWRGVGRVALGAGGEAVEGGAQGGLEALTRPVFEEGRLGTGTEVLQGTGMGAVMGGILGGAMKAAPEMAPRIRGLLGRAEAGDEAAARELEEIARNLDPSAFEGAAGTVRGPEGPASFEMSTAEPPRAPKGTQGALGPEGEGQFAMLPDTSETRPLKPGTKPVIKESQETGFDLVPEQPGAETPARPGATPVPEKPAPAPAPEPTKAEALAQEKRNQHVIERVQKLLPKAKMTQEEDGSFTFRVGKAAKQLRVKVGVDKVNISAEDVAAGWGKGKKGKVAGGYTPRQHSQSIELGVDGLIEIASGKGTRTAAHELIHFFRDNDMISQKDWNRMVSQATDRATRHSEWGQRDKAGRDELIEEAIADLWGDYAAGRIAAKGEDVPGLAAFRPVWDTVRDFYRAVKGGADLPFEKLLTGQYAGEERIGTRAGERLREIFGGEEGAAIGEDLSTRRGRKASVDDDDYDVEVLDPDEGFVNNASAESGSGGSREATNRIAALAGKGETQVRVTPGGEIIPTTEDGGIGLPRGWAFGHITNDGTFIKRDGSSVTPSRTAVAAWRRQKGVDAKLPAETTRNVQDTTPATAKTTEVKLEDDPELADFFEKMGITEPKKKASLEPESQEEKASKEFRMTADGKIATPEIAEGNRRFMAAALARLRGETKGLGNLARGISEPPQKKVVLGTDDQGRKIVIGRVSVEDHFDRTMEWLGGKDSEEFKAALTWYEDLRKHFVEEFGEPNADKYLAMWAASQQQASPSEGLKNVFKAEDIAKGFAREVGRAGLGHDRLLAYARNLPAGLGQKLADFADASRGKLTRSWVNNDPAGLKPTPFDLHAVRDRGYIDQTVYNWVEKKYGKKVADRLNVTHSVKSKDGLTDAAPTAAEYAEGTKFYNDAADYYSKRLGFKVEPHQVQAMGWVAIQKMLGKNPESVVELFGKNKYTTTAEARPGVDAKKMATFDALAPEAKARVTDRAMDFILPKVAAATGVRVSRREGSVGRYEGDVSPNAVFDVMGTPEQIQGFSDALARVMGQQEVWSLKTMPNSQANALVVDISSKKLAAAKDRAAAQAVADSILAKLRAAGIDSPGYSIRDGKLRLISLPESKPAITRGDGFVAKGAERTPSSISEGPITKHSSKVQMALASINDPDLSAEVYGSQLIRGKGGQDAGPARRVDRQGGATMGDLRSEYDAEFGRLLDVEARGGTYGPDRQLPPPTGPVAEPKKKASFEEFGAKDRPEEEAARARGDYDKEADIRAGRVGRTEWQDFRRRLTGPVLRRLEQMKSGDTGRPVGKLIADQMRNARSEGERSAGKYMATYDRSLKAFDRAAGSAKDADFERVVKALDGWKNAQGQVEVRYPDLKPHEKSLYTIMRSITNKVKADAKAAGSWSGQEVRNYFPHKFKRQGYEFDEMAQRHLDWLQTTPEGQKRLGELRQQDAAWLGLLGPGSELELAALDLARNFDAEGGLYRKSGHLEMQRLGGQDEIRMDRDVFRQYLQEVYPRIEAARRFGSKSELARTGISQLGKQDRQFASDAIRTFMGTMPKSSPMGRAGNVIARELNAIQGLTKLGLASIAQLSQGSVTASHLTGRQGAKGVMNLMRAARDMVTAHGNVAEDATRAASTFASDSREVADRWSSSDALVTRALGKVTEVLAGKKAREVLIDGVWGVTAVDKEMRRLADRAGRYLYLDAVEKGDVGLLTEMLGSDAAARTAIRTDGPNVDALRKALKAGRLGDVAIGSTSKGTPSFREGVERMDRAAKQVADKTQFRTNPENAPMSFQSPTARTFNTFLSFMYQHWRWQADEATAAVNAIKGKDWKEANRRGAALAAYYAVFAPIFGSAALHARSLLTGRGTEEEDLRLKSNVGKALSFMGTNPIDGRTAQGWEKALEFLQAVQFAGGMGYPSSIVERGARALNVTGDEPDPGRAAANVMGANVGMGYDYFQAARALGEWAAKKADGTATQADWEKAVRRLIDASAHVTPAPLGLGSMARRYAKEKLVPSKQYPQTAPGWYGLGDEGGTWGLEHGVTSPEREKGREDRARREMLAQKKARLKAQIEARKRAGR